MSESPGRLAGRPIVFNERALIHTALGDFFEEVAPSAFNAVFSRGVDSVLLRDHDPGRILARTTSRTLDLKISSLGIEMRALMPDTELARETLALVERGDLVGMSFGFSVASDQWFDTDPPTRRIIEIRNLFDVSVVTFAAYPQTSVSVSRDDGLYVLPAAAAAVRRFAVLKTREALERRGRQIKPSARMRMMVRSRGGRVERVTPLSADNFGAVSC